MYSSNENFHYLVVDWFWQAPNYYINDYTLSGYAISSMG